MFVTQSWIDVHLSYLCLSQNRIKCNFMLIVQHLQFNFLPNVVFVSPNHAIRLFVTVQLKQYLKKWRQADMREKLIFDLIQYHISS